MGKTMGQMDELRNARRNRTTLNTLFTTIPARLLPFSALLPSTTFSRANELLNVPPQSFSPKTDHPTKTHCSSTTLREPGSATPASSSLLHLANPAKSLLPHKLQSGPTRCENQSHFTPSRLPHLAHNAHTHHVLHTTAAGEGLTLVATVGRSFISLRLAFASFEEQGASTANRVARTRHQRKRLPASQPTLRVS